MSNSFCSENKDAEKCEEFSDGVTGFVDFWAGSVHDALGAVLWDVRCMADSLAAECEERGGMEIRIALDGKGDAAYSVDFGPVESTSNATSGFLATCIDSWDGR